MPLGNDGGPEYETIAWNADGQCGETEGRAENDHGAGEAGSVAAGTNMEQLVCRKEQQDGQKVDRTDQCNGRTASRQQTVQPCADISDCRTDKSEIALPLTAPAPDGG